MLVIWNGLSSLIGCLFRCVYWRESLFSCSCYCSHKSIHFFGSIFCCFAWSTPSIGDTTCCISVLSLPGLHLLLKAISLLLMNASEGGLYNQQDVSVLFSAQNWAEVGFGGCFTDKRATDLASVCSSYPCRSSRMRLITCSPREAVRGWRSSNEWRARSLPSEPITLGIEAQSRGRRINLNDCSLLKLRRYVQSAR